MCVSATASFAASAGLLVVGVAIQRRYHINSYQQAFAIIPLIFAAHQFFEGVVWLGVNGTVPNIVQTVAVYSFAVIAFSGWPVYIPIALYCYEHNPSRVYIIPVLTLGIVVAIYFIWAFTLYSPLQLVVDCDGEACAALSYRYQLPYLKGTINYFYLAAVTLPMFLSQNPRIRYFLAPVILLTFPLAKAISGVFTFASIWCFIAALASVCVFFTFSEQKKGRPEAA